MSPFNVFEVISQDWLSILLLEIGELEIKGSMINAGYLSQKKLYLRKKKENKTIISMLDSRKDYRGIRCNNKNAKLFED